MTGKSSSTATTPKRKAPTSSNQKGAKKKKKDVDDEESSAKDEKVEDIQEDGSFVSMILKHEKHPKHDETIVFFERRRKISSNSDDEIFYSVHGKDAIFIDKHFSNYGSFKYHEKKGECDKDHPYIVDGVRYAGLPYLTFRPALYEQFVKGILLDHRKRLEIWADRKSNYECIKSASPGNLQSFEEIIFKSDTAPGIVCSIMIKQDSNERRVGIAYANTSLRIIGFCSFADNNQLAVLDSALAQMEAKEGLICISKNDILYTKVLDIFARTDIMCTELKRSAFVRKPTLEADICKLTGKNNVENPEFNDECVACATQALIDYLELVDDRHNYSYFKTKSFVIQNFMKLDSSCIASLNLLPSPNDRKKYDSLFGLLNECVTKPGSRLLREWIRQPLTDQSQIENRLDMVEIFVEEHELREEIRTALKKIPDLDILCSKIAKFKITCDDIIKLYACVQQLPIIKESLEKVRNEKTFNEEGIFFSVLLQLEDLCAALIPKFPTLVHTSLDLENATDHSYRLNPNLDDNLKEIAEELSESIKLLDEECKRVQDEEALKKEELTLVYTKKAVYMQVGGKVANKFNNNENYIALGGTKQQFKFTTKNMMSLTENYRLCQEKYDACSDNLLYHVKGAVGSYSQHFSDLRDALAELDIFAAFAEVSTRSAKPYVRPIIKPLDAEEDEIYLINCRHPCVEVQDGIDFQMNSCLFDRSSHQLHIITGPNMGGKSTYIRQVAINVILAQMGCFIPAEAGSIVSIRDAILSRVGASDSTSRGISTFMAEMLETSAILSTATNKTLIIIDELGRGTSTYDGFGLAYAIVEHLSRITNAYTLFATHFHELKVLTEDPESNRVCCKRMESVLMEELKMLYKVVDDDETSVNSNNSFGIEVAKLAHFPPDIIRVAQMKSKEIESIINMTEAPIVPQNTKESTEERAKMHQALCKFANFDFTNKSLEEIAQFLQTHFP
ncbi:hypothetical protein FDP41_007834 [Naegleria fowleri]|uniref:DNA mismatch repair proteins mutS family domain-containing protein n=1 Tax=Naegleria fowleri TaxID=5763 RepID=A0A6A5CF27_NAEFO|nr:uncharacterized protein FDP41_007834 [Naegleria fowleri]KAF0983919.1 hypothetical protein FDP41_007834 [Naegleria fowleri]CAG4719552.1 unnamed protein product [Naegleria fowleri]